MANQPAVGFQLGFTGAAGADGALLTLQMGPHAGKPRQQVFVLGQLYLQPALFGFGSLGKDVENQRAAVEHPNLCHLLQCAVLRGRQVIVEYDHRRIVMLYQLGQLRGLALAKQRARIRGGPVLQHFGATDSTGGLQKGFQLVQACICGGLFARKDGGIEPHQNGALQNRTGKGIDKNSSSGEE